MVTSYKAPEKYFISILEVSKDFEFDSGLSFADSISGTRDALRVP